MTTRDDFEMLLAHHLRVFRKIDLQAIDGVIARARGQVVDWQVNDAVDARNRALALLEVGSFDAAMEAGQALFFAANGLYNALESSEPLRRDAKRQEGTRKPRRPEVQDWIERQVQRNTGETAAELYKRAPDYVCDAVGEGRFAKRVSDAKKKMDASK